MTYTWNLNPVAFSILGLDVRWYGLAYLLGYFLAIYLGFWAYQKFIKPHHQKTSFPIFDKNRFENLIFTGFLVGVLGGRLGTFVFYEPQTFWVDPLQVLKIWEGGMSIHGGFLALLLWSWWNHRQKKFNALSFADSLVLPISFGLFFGRLTNFVNGELYGRATDQTWGVIFPHVDQLLRHPSQAYEAGKNLMLALLIYLALRQGWGQYPGRVLAVFLIGYGVFRWSIEWVRQPEIMLGCFSVGQWLCVMMILGGGALWYRTWEKT